MSSNVGMLAGAVALAFVAGWVLSRLTGLMRGKKAVYQTPEQHRQIRSLEASLRIARKHAEEMKTQFEATCVDFNALKESHERLEEAFEGRAQDLDEANDALRFESNKVNELRRELTVRAEEQIRAEAHAKAIETELSVMEAGSNVMQGEVERLAAERKDLTDQLLAATGSFDGAALKDAAGASAANAESGEPQQRKQRSTEEFLPDC